MHFISINPYSFVLVDKKWDRYYDPMI